MGKRTPAELALEAEVRKLRERIAQLEEGRQTALAPLQIARQLRHTGIPVIGDAPWGTHFCQFYRDKQELMDTLVPYFKAGLENNEFCMWVTSEPLRAEEANAALAEAVEGLDGYIRKGQLEILDYSQFYLVDGKFESNRVLRGWVDRLEAALARGFDGLRLTANRFWLEKPDWQDFTEYEAAVDRVIGQYRMIALCTYSLARCGAIEVMDVASNHAFALFKRSGKWEIIENAGRKKAEAEISRSQRTFSELVERAPFGIYIVDSRFRIALMNAGSQTRAFRNVQPAIGRDFAEVIRIIWPEPAATEFIGRFRHTLETGEPYYAPPFVNQRRDIAAVEAYEWELHRMTLPDGQYGVVCYYFDSTELRRTEEALRQSEARFRSVLEGSRDVIYRFNVQTGRFEYISASAENLLGFSVEELMTLDSEATIAMIHPDDRPAFRSAIERLNETGKAEAEYRQLLKSGGYRWMSNVMSLTIDGAGKPLYGNGNIREITLRKRAEEALRNSEKCLAADLDALMRLHEIGSLFAREGNLEAVLGEIVDAAIAISGADFGNIQLLDPQSSFLKIVAQRGFPTWWVDFWNQVSEGHGACGTALEYGERVIVEDVERSPIFAGTPALKIQLRAGVRAVQSTPLVGRSGRCLGMFSTHYKTPRTPDDRVLRLLDLIARQTADIIERAQAENALAAAAQRLNAHMDNSPLAVIEFDPQFRVTRWSAEAEKVFGWRADEILGQATVEMGWIHEDDVEAVSRLNQDMLAGKRPRNLSVNRNYRKDGSIVECEWYNSAIYGSDGKLSSILSQVLDITERKRAEAALREKQKFESLGLLAGGVAHDFNNLLVGVIGNASLVQEMLPPDHPAAELVQAVVKIGEQAAHLTRQMLAYSGKGQFLVEALDLSEMVRDISELLRPSIPKKIALLLDLGPDLPPIEADRGQLQQILMNLVINAAEAIGSHDGLIRVRTGVQALDDRYLRAHSEARDLSPGEYVALEVRDTGSGMDEKVRGRIFDPFFSTKFTGRGLGLAAVAGIVRGHKGAIVVSSDPGKGSTFTVLFPPAARPLELQPAMTAGVVARGSGVVLVIDDEQLVRDIAQRALAHNGYKVLVADSGPAAIDVYKRHAGKIDLTILDLSMPGMSGEETLPELRKIRPEVKVIISSGYSEAEAMKMFEGQHVSAFIQKPYTSRVLAQRVKLTLQ